MAQPQPEAIQLSKRESRSPLKSHLRHHIGLSSTLYEVHVWVCLDPPGVGGRVQVLKDVRGDVLSVGEDVGEALGAENGPETWEKRDGTLVSFP